MSVVRITDLSDTRLDAFRSLQTNNTTRDRGWFVAEGTTVARRLFDSDFECELLLVDDKKWDGFHQHIPDGTSVLRVTNSLASELVGFNFHQGVLACGKRKPSPDLVELIQAGGARQTFIVGPHIMDPENIGTLIRIGAGFGVTAVIFGDGCADPFSRRALRVSMANGLFTPIIQTNDLERVFATLTAHGVKSYATLLDPDATSLESIQPPARSALVFGHESHGLESGFADLCDERVTIPMRGGTDSLNVAVAAGIFLFHFTRGQS